jgi:DNA polymerase-3 subunit gamma/tau
MSYQVIARKYRPQRFSDVVGQGHVTQTLSNAITQKRIAHAYLFVGPRGTGKTTIARIFAKCLNCTDGPKAEFDEKDPRCVEITEGRSLDVLEIDGASNRGIDEIRELRETARYAPATSRYKIYIVDEVHMLTKEAFNALLKTLEEPPAHVKFMFATTEPEKVLPTILSRCQRFDLRRIPASMIVQHLGAIAQKEKVRIDEDALHAIARGADGGMRDAESTLDQLISFCGEQIQETDVLSMFGLAARGQIMRLAQSILEGEAEPTLRELDDLARNGKDLGRLLGDLLNHFRNLMIFQISRGDRGLMEVSDAEFETLSSQAGTAAPAVITRVMDTLADGEGRLRDAASKRILLEVTLLKAMQARNAMPIDEVLKQLHQLRNQADGGGAPQGAAAVARPASQPANPSRPPQKEPEIRQVEAATVLPAPAPTISAPTGDLEPLWAGLLEAVGRASPFTRSYLLEAHPVSFAKNVLTIGFDPEFADHLGLVDHAKTHTLLQTKLGELGHPQAQIKFIKADAPAGRRQPTAPAKTAPQEPAPSTPASNAGKTARAAHGGTPAQSEPALDKEKFKNDPLIKKALEIFKGQIVDIRA